MHSRNLRLISSLFDGVVLFASSIALAYWLVSTPIGYSDSNPILAPFTALSLALMSAGRLSHKYLTNWPMPLTMAWLGIVIGGNLTSIFIQLVAPNLLNQSFPHLVATSVMTSCGLITYCIYELLILIRDTPNRIFILDDILIHIAIIPGGISFMGHLIDNPLYYASSIDPRVGIGYFEIFLMSAYTAATLLNNGNLFLWKFLTGRLTNRVIFSLLFINQFIAPLLIAHLSANRTSQTTIGLELYVMVAGIIATLTFLLVQSWVYMKNIETTSTNFGKF